MNNKKQARAVEKKIFTGYEVNKNMTNDSGKIFIYRL